MLVSKMIKRIGRTVVRLCDSLYGYDFFISYRQSTCGDYATALRKVLISERPTFRSFVDRTSDGFVAGSAMRSEMDRAVRTSTSLIALIEINAFAEDSHYMPQEVFRFEKEHKLIIPIDLDGTLRRARADAEFKKLLPKSEVTGRMLRILLNRITVEDANGIQKGPAKDVVEKLKGSVDAVTRAVHRSRIFACVSVSFLVVAAMAVVFGFGEKAARETAKRERDEAIRQALAYASYSMSDTDPTVALDFGVRALETGANDAAELSLVKAFNTGSWFFSHRFPGAWDADFSPDSKHVAWIRSDGTLHIDHLSTDEKIVLKNDASYLKYVPNGNIITWKGWQGKGTLGQVSLLGPTGTLISQHKFEFMAAFVGTSGHVFVPAFLDNSMVLYRIDPKTGVSGKFDLPEEIKNLDIIAAPLNDGRGIVLASRFPGQIAVVECGAKPTIFPIPSEYMASSIDVDIQNRRAAVYLSGVIKGTADALGWIELNNVASTEIKFVPLPNSPGFDSAGISRFLPDERVLASSTDGWTRAIRLDDGSNTEFPERKRAPDQVAVSPQGDLVVIARRSGAATVFTLDGVAVGQLLGERHSDGHNPAFRRLVFSGDGTMIISVAQSGARIWRRPESSLSILHSETFRPFDDLPESAIRSIRSLSSKSLQNSVDVCPGTQTILINDSGQLEICVKSRNHFDRISTGLLRGDIEIMGTQEIENIGFRLIADQVDRLFVLSASMIASFVKAEQKAGRIWKNELEENSDWGRERLPKVKD